jgi:hypothetical protein
VVPGGLQPALSAAEAHPDGLCWDRLPASGVHQSLSQHVPAQAERAVWCAEQRPEASFGCFPAASRRTLPGRPLDGLSHRVVGCRCERQRDALWPIFGRLCEKQKQHIKIRRLLKTTPRSHCDVGVSQEGGVEGEGGREAAVAKTCIYICMSAPEGINPTGHRAAPGPPEQLKVPSPIHT